MPLKFWDETFMAATFLINRLPSKVIDNHTPFEKLLQQKPEYSSLRIFGCACWPNLRPYNRHKLELRSKQCAFLGYSNLHKGYKCLDIQSGRVYISSDVIFDEGVFPFSTLHSNAGARLRAEIALLPPSLVPFIGTEQLVDHVFDSTNHATNSEVAAYDHRGSHLPPSAEPEEDPASLPADTAGAGTAPAASGAPQVDVPPAASSPGTRQSDEGTPPTADAVQHGVSPVLPPASDPAAGLGGQMLPLEMTALLLPESTAADPCLYQPLDLLRLQQMLLRLLHHLDHELGYVMASVSRRFIQMA